MYNDIDIFVPLSIKVRNGEEFLKELLLRPLEMKQVSGVMQNAKAVELVEENLGVVSESYRHFRRS